MEDNLLDCLGHPVDLRKKTATYVSFFKPVTGNNTSIGPNV